MLSLTRKADYALVAMVYLGHLRCKQAGPVSARQVAQRFGLPLPLLMNVLKALANAGMIRSTRGVSGGYELLVDPDQVPLLSVVRAVEHAEPEQYQPLGPGSTGSAAAEVVERMHQRVDGFLNQLTLQDLLQETEVDELISPAASGRARPAQADSSRPARSTDEND